MAKRLSIGKYWPAALFAASNIAAVTLVIRANSANETPSTARAPMTASTRRLAEKPFEPVDPVNAADTGGNFTPLVFDWGSEFDVDAQAAKRNPSSGLVAGAARGLASLRASMADATSAQGRALREAELMREPLNLNLFNTSGQFIGRRPLLPPVDFTLPPLSPLLATTVPVSPTASAQVYNAGPRTLNVVVDPAVFKDPQAMASFLTNLSKGMVAQGVQPSVHVTQQASAAGAGAIPTAPYVVTTPPPLRTRSGAAIPTTAALPPPPADIVRGEAPPTFRPDIGPPTPAITAPAPRTPVAAPPAPAARPEPPAAPKPSNQVDLAGSDTSRSTTTPTAAKPRLESRVNVRIRLASFSSKQAAQRALGALQGAGLGGSMTQDNASGLQYWVVRTRVFHTRSEADRALSQVRGMGYEAWKN